MIPPWIFPSMWQPGTWTGLGTLMAGASVYFGKEILGQLRGQKNENGSRGKCLRDLIIDVMHTVDEHAQESERRHIERIQAFGALQVEFAELKGRVSMIEARSPKRRPPKTKAAGVADAKCTTCHTAMGKKDLNAVGDFAKANMKNGEPDYAKVAAHIAKK